MTEDLGPPTVAWVDTKEDGRVECLIEQTTINEWQATPVREVRLSEVETVYVNVIPPKSTVNFVILPDE